MNPRIEKITAEIEKVKAKLTSYQTRLRDLERQKTEFENADILAMVRGVDVSPDEFAAFVKMFKAQQAEQVGALPDVEAYPTGEAATGTNIDTALQGSNGGGSNAYNDGENTQNSENDKEEIQ